MKELCYSTDNSEELTEIVGCRMLKFLTSQNTLLTPATLKAETDPLTCSAAGAATNARLVYHLCKDPYEIDIYTYLHFTNARDLFDVEL